MAKQEVESEVTGNVWKVLKSTGDSVEAGEVIMILESMKMEIPIVAEIDGTVIEVRCNEGDSVIEGQVLLMVDPD